MYIHYKYTTKCYKYTYFPLLPPQKVSQLSAGQIRQGGLHALTNHKTHLKTSAESWINSQQRVRTCCRRQ